VFTPTSSAWILLWWPVRFWLCEKDLPHNVQLYGLLPVWTLICWLRWLLLVNDLSHNVQPYGFSPVWVLLCRIRSTFWKNDLLHCWQLNFLVSLTWIYWWWGARFLLHAKDLPHTVQLYGFSPVYTLICWLRSLFRTKNLPHCEQLNILVLSGSTTSVCLFWRW
jgi:hypothetical protein